MARFALFDRSRRAARSFLILISLALTAALVLASQRIVESGGVECRDYTNKSWQGEPARTRVERDFATPAFLVPPNSVVGSFSTDCQATMRIARAGDFNLLLLTRNRAELSIDEQPLLQTTDAQLQHAARSVHLAAGQHPLRFRYASTRVDEPQLDIAPAGSPLRPLHTSYVSRFPVPTAVYGLRGPARIARVLLPALWVGLVAYLLREPLMSLLRRVGAPLVKGHHVIMVHPQRCVMVLVGVAAVPRLALDLGTYPILWPDSVQYYDTALAYLRGDFLSHNFLSTPLFSAFVAMFLAWRNTPDAGALMIAAQRGLAVIGTLLIFQLAREAFDKTVAFYAALLWTLSVVELYYETVVGTEALFVFVLLLTVMTAARMLRSASLFTAWLTGVMCAVATLTRPVAKALMVVVLAVAWYRARERRRLTLRSAVLVATFCVSVAPWMYVNQRTYGFWGINRGEGLWLFLRVFDIDEVPAQASTRFPQVKEVVDALLPTHPYLHYAVRDELNFGRGYSAVQADEVMFGYALEAALAHPVQFAVGTLKQFVWLFVAPYRSVSICQSPDGPQVCSERSADLSFRAFPNHPLSGRRPLRTIIAAYFRVAYWVVPCLAPLAALGMVRSLRERDERQGLRLLLALIVLYLGLASAVFNTVQDRYRLPVDAFVITFAVAELCHYGRRVMTITR